MIAKYKKNKKESQSSVFFSILLGIIILIVIGFLVISNFKINQKKAELTSQIETLREEVRILEERRQILEARIFQAGKEEYLEWEARERFNLKKPGEGVVIILPPEEKNDVIKEKEKERAWLAPLEILYSATIDKIISLFR